MSLSSLIADIPLPARQWAVSLSMTWLSSKVAQQNSPIEEAMLPVAAILLQHALQIPTAAAVSDAGAS